MGELIWWTPGNMVDILEQISNSRNLKLQAHAEYSESDGQCLLEVMTALTNGDLCGSKVASILIRDTQQIGNISLDFRILRNIEEVHLTNVQGIEHIPYIPGCKRLHVGWCDNVKTIQKPWVYELIYLANLPMLKCLESPPSGKEWRTISFHMFRTQCVLPISLPRCTDLSLSSLDIARTPHAPLCMYLSLRDMPHLVHIDNCNLSNLVSITVNNCKSLVDFSIISNHKMRTPYCKEGVDPGPPGIDLGYPIALNCNHWSKERERNWLNL